MLELKGVQIVYPGPPSHLAVSDIDLVVPHGSTVGLVGESGSGKSSLARCVMGLVRATEGSVLLDGTDVTNPRGRALEVLRSQVQMVFQDPRSSLNPRIDVGTSVEEAVRVAAKGPRTDGHRPPTTPELFDMVGLDPALAGRFPHQLSGGQLQRIAIARALARRPQLLLLDEVTASLDVSAQAVVLNLLRRIQREQGIAMLYISHDLSVIRYVSDHLYILQRGEMVEQGDCEQIFSAAQHPYTQALLAAVPTLGGARWRDRRSSGLAPALET